VKFLLDHDVPDDVVYSLLALGHDVHKLRDVLPATTADEEVLRMASERNSVLITCNRDDFLGIAQQISHAGIIILVRRRSRALERAALVQLLDSAGEVGIRGNINFA
jgi:predicted nuclease of predicted toxin-antitoxin system